MLFTQEHLCQIEEITPVVFYSLKGSCFSVSILGASNTRRDEFLIFSQHLKETLDIEG